MPPGRRSSRLSRVRRRRPARSSPTRTVPASARWSSSCPPASTSEIRGAAPMSDVLVVAELAEGAVAKPTLELLTLARRIGTPVAVVFGSAALIAAKLGEYGAARILEVTDPAIEEYLVAPKAEALAQLAASAGASAVLIRSGAGGEGGAGGGAGKLGPRGVTHATPITPPGRTAPA